MAVVYIGYSFKVRPIQPGRDILLAQLGEVGFESFDETEDGLEAFIQKSDWHESILEGIQILTSKEFTINYNLKEIEPINWNAEWENNFPAIQVDDICSVRAPFHPKPDVVYDIIIEPKMSFGTGHHETTFMMLQNILENDFVGKTVLDMGCGTAVLAILAEMRGASKLDAVDIDPWCYENSKENVGRNSRENISVYEGDVSFLKDQKYDVIIANINRNILLQDIHEYARCLSENGVLFLSGFYSEDLQIITDACNREGLSFVDSKERNNWIAAKFVC